MKEQLLEILTTQCPGVDFETEKKLIENGVYNADLFSDL